MRLALALVVLVSPAVAHAHPLGLGALVVEETDDALDVTLRVSPDEARVARPVLLTEGCDRLSERRYEEADGTTTEIVRARCAPAATIGVAGLDGTSVRVLVSYGERRVFLDAGTRSFVLDAREPETSFAASIALGAEHVATGLDHLLFVLGLFFLVRSRRALVLAITGFTLGHSATLALAALELVRVPAAPVEILIAISLVLLALEVARGEAKETHAPGLAAGFGLVHGLGFASALLDLGAPSWQTLFGFNVGVEIGQLAFVGLVVLATAALRSRIAQQRLRVGAAHLVGAAGVYFVLDRVTAAG